MDDWNWEFSILIPMHRLINRLKWLSVCIGTAQLNCTASAELYFNLTDYFCWNLDENDIGQGMVTNNLAINLRHVWSRLQICFKSYDVPAEIYKTNKILVVVNKNTKCTPPQCMFSVLFGRSIAQTPIFFFWIRMGDCAPNLLSFYVFFLQIFRK